MKKAFYKIKILVTGFCLIFIASCEKDLLDKTPLDAISNEAVWADPDLVNAFVNARYNQIGHGWYSESWVSSMCDETWLTWSRNCEPITQGYVSPSTPHSMNGGRWGESERRWDIVWMNIANCNIFFDNVDKCTFPDPALKARLIGEVTFIRALMYWDLINRWGGMPLITKSYDINTVSEIADIKRNSYKENIDFLVAECDKAAAALPASFTGSNKGRAKSVAALALKSRVLLYAASPLMNDARSDDQNFLVHYQTPDANRWQKAADAAQAAITAALAGGYSLFDSYGDDVKTKYTQLFLEGGNSEVLFDRQGGPSSAGTYICSYKCDQVNGPNGFGQWGGNTPIAEFINEFEMNDGTPFDWNNPAHRANPFQNRDKRLYAYVLCNGDPWLGGRNVEGYKYIVSISGTDTTWNGGKDTQYGGDSWNTSQTGYNMRKFLDPTYGINSWNFKARNWIWFRLAEMYLNLAEAKFNLADEPGAQTVLNVIRARARMPNVTSTGTALRDAIYHERRIELAFEEHRYFDVRRWKIADVVLNKDATGIIIIRNPDLTFTYRTKLVEIRTFAAPKMYWLPIQLDEITKNPNLEQNPGY